MDPQARRELRVQIQSYAQEGRSVLLTSHAMDECQDLCTTLGVMVNGRFVCLGSPAHLRLKFGRGYTILLKCGSKVAAAKNGVAQLFADAVLTEEHSRYLNYAVPLDAMPSLQTAFAGLEQLRAAGAVEDYELSRTTLEDIFCQFARKQRECDGVEGDAANGAGSSEERADDDDDALLT